MSKPWPVIVKTRFGTKIILETNTDDFPIPHVGNRLDIVHADAEGSCYYVTVERVEHHFNTRTKERCVYVECRAI